MTENNIALIGHDHRGHGYSPGERAFFRTHETLLEDWHTLIKSCRNPNDSDCAAMFEEPGVDVIEHLSKLPYFLIGQSMSGGLCTLLSSRLLDDPLYVGIVLLAPALCPTPASPIVKWLLCNVIAHVAPLSLLYTSVDNTLALKHEKDIRYIELDGWGNPDAIGWNRGMHFGTAAGFVGMFNTISASLTEVRTPLLVFHDPGDGITPYEGVRQLMQLAPSEDKTEVTLEGGLHELLTNEFDTVLPKTVEWVMARLEKAAPTN